jgi:type II secretory pathway predicted ATPase ExeA/phage tail protein X
MYTDFYHLREKPFNLTSSPRFLFLSETHKEALALLTCGIMERKGFALLTGEVGAGKSTIVQALLQELGSAVQAVYLTNPLMKGEDFINYIGFTALGRKEHFKSKSEFLRDFEAFLKTCRKNQKNFVLIIDEAQKLSFSLLEEIRLLSNMESAEEKLINIFLVGQPELNDQLSKPQCRALLQRISLRHHISPMNFEETRDYVRTRLRVAGAADPDALFSKQVIKALHQYSSGYPRMINILADNSLLLGYSRRTRKITASMISECYQDLQIEGSSLKASFETPKATGNNPKPWPMRISYPQWSAAILSAILLCAVWGFPDGHDIIRSLRRIVAPEMSRNGVSGNDLDKVVVREKLSREAFPPGETDSRNIEREAYAPAASRDFPPEAANPQLGDPHPKPVAQDRVPKEPSRAAPGQKDLPSLVTVKNGDTLTQLAIKIYGRFDKELLRLIQRQNPGLPDVNLIMPGQEIIFPAVKGTLKSGSFPMHVASSREDVAETTGSFKRPLTVDLLEE